MFNVQCIGFLGIFLFSLGLRFWGLGRFDELVFDEVYFAKYGYNYLQQISFFDVHPPLGKYLISLGIWLHTYLFKQGDTAVAYRWLNAFTGSFLPLIVGGIAYQLTRRSSYALIASFLAATDGLLLVESRYGLINIYLLAFGLLGQLLFLLALNLPHKQQFYFLYSGIFFSFCLAVKWNGLGFLLGIYLFYGLVKGTEKLKFSLHHSLWQQLSKINLLDFLLNFAVIPALIYRLLWIPHLAINQEFDFWQVHQQIFGYHNSIGNTTTTHPYCSAWYTWPLMLRPVGYYYQQVENSVGNVTIYDVHAIGNPLLWWLSTGAILILCVGLFVQLTKYLRKRKIHSENFCISIFLILNYAANFLPWLKVTRCTYIYHYMGASLFAFLALAWLIDKCFNSSLSQYKYFGVIAIAFIFCAYLFWLPIYLGLPLSQPEFATRMWLSSWR
ncbi:MAG: phospholipid carrier-dependent glycosyltransferase [Spirulinaceae cyanobacterium]